MSVRSRIKDFEELAKANESSNEKGNHGAKKRFHYPGNKRTSDSEESPAVNNYAHSRLKTQRFDEFEADLQAAWSVRKNIHHQGTSPQTSHSSSSLSSAPNVHSQAKPGQYSRHGAIPAQPMGGPRPVVGAREQGHPLESHRSPLQEKNSKDTPWNVKKTVYSYNSTETATKRPIGSPQASKICSPPTAKRRGNAGIFDMIRPTNEQGAAQYMSSPPEHHDKSEKVSYAKRMAQGYLKSVGMGEWTPKINTSNTTLSPTKTESIDSFSANKWNSIDDDQDFDF